MTLSGLSLRYPARWAAALPLIAALYVTIWGVHLTWMLTVAIAAVMALAVPVVAADLLPVALAYLGLHWMVYALVQTQTQTQTPARAHPAAITLPNWMALHRQIVNFAANAGKAAPGRRPAILIYAYRALPVPRFLTVPAGHWTVLAGGYVAAGLGAVLFAGWLIPRTMGLHAGVMKRNGELSSRVSRLTASRGDAIDAAAAELRRVERDLHDGAQARLVALGISLRATERLIGRDPQAALSLVAEARETSAKALADLRTLVRGINPPVLAERGLRDAIEALALDTPVATVTDVDLDGRPAAPVEAAVYFAVAEIMANAAKHAAARTVHITARHDSRNLRVEIADDGSGGADPAAGTGLAGVERRLGTFDGILAISSPPGGPTIVVIEVPCALSSPRISTC